MSSASTGNVPVEFKGRLLYTRFASFCAVKSFSSVSTLSSSRRVIAAVAKILLCRVLSGIPLAPQIAAA
jgi:hypothetical protein